MENIQGKKHTVVNGNYFSIYHKIEGVVLHEANLGVNALHSVAKHLAKLHGTADRLELPYAAEKIQSLKVVEQRAMLIKDLIHERSQEDYINNIALKLIALKLKTLNNLITDTDLKALSFSKYLIHGDFHNQNILFNIKDELVGILDLEEVHYGHPTEDIMHFIYLACCNTGYNEININRAKIFLKEYLAYNDLPKEEIKLGVRMYMHKVSSSFFLEDQLFSHNVNDLAPFLERDLKSLEYLYEHLDEFASNLVGITE